MVYRRPPLTSRPQMLRRQPLRKLIEIPSGALGTRETLKQMRGLVQKGKHDQRIRDLANGIVSHVPGKDWRGELAALLDYVRANVRYSLDPNDIETIQGAAGTLALGYGDCDDSSVLLATLAECIGHPCCLVAFGFEAPGNFEHVMTFASGAGETPWLGMDATEPHGLGWFPPGAICEMVTPVSETAEGALGRFWL